MKKVLVYVDAENVCTQELQKVMEYVNSNLADELVVGKFYGNSLVLGEIKDECLSIGFEYIETSSLSKGSKNITDMKIVVDCISDVCALHRHEITKVVILTKDNDFYPLVHKVTGFGVQVACPLLAEMRTVTIGDVHEKLQEFGYDPVRCGIESFDNQFNAIRAVLPDEFSDNLIDMYIDRKKKKFVKSMQVVCSDKQVNELNALTTREFDLARCIQIIKGNKTGDSAFSQTVSIEQLAKTYQLKMYGRCMNDENIGYFVKCYLRRIG